MVQILAENNESGTPTAEELAGWAEQYSVNFPVVSDEGWAVGSRFEQDGGIPSMTLLAPGAEVVVVDSFTAESEIESVLPN